MLQEPQDQPQEPRMPQEPQVQPQEPRMLQEPQVQPHEARMLQEPLGINPQAAIMYRHDLLSYQDRWRVKDVMYVSTPPPAFTMYERYAPVMPLHPAPAPPLFPLR